MVQEIKIQNTVTGKSLKINKSDRPFILQSVNWDTPAVTMESYRVPFQIGETLSGVMVGTRKPTITGYIVSNRLNLFRINSWEEYYALQEKDIEESKKLLDSVISIYQEIVIEANGYFLRGTPTQPPKYSTKDTENNEILCLFQLELECFNPMFYSDNKSIDLASTIERLHFPLVLPEEGVVFSEILRRQSMAITNEGNVKAGCTILISANGGIVENPKIYNVNTNEFIAFKGITLNNGDYIKITTSIGEENAILHRAEDSSEISIVGYTTKGSKYIQIEQGTNYYAYEVDSQYLNNISVSIEFTEQFFNIRGM